MSKHKPIKRYCPAVDRVVDFEGCLEICQASIHKTLSFKEFMSFDSYYDDYEVVEGWKEICKNCDHFFHMH